MNIPLKLTTIEKEYSDTLNRLCSDYKRNCTDSSHGVVKSIHDILPKRKKKMHKIGIFSHENFHEVIKFTKITF